LLRSTKNNNQTTPFIYMKMAADMGHVDAAFAYAANLLKLSDHHGHASRPSTPETAKYLKKAAEGGHAAAQFLYAIQLSTGEGTQQDHEAADFYMRESAKQGNQDAQYALGVSLDQKNQAEEAYKWFVAAVERGNPKAMFALAVYLWDGRTSHGANGAEANRYLKMSADAGFPEAMFYYAVNLVKGDGVRRNPSEGTKYLRRAAEAGHAQAMYFYASHLGNGIGAEQNVVDAFRWMQKAAEAKNDLAIEFMREHRDQALARSLFPTLPYSQRSLFPTLPYSPGFLSPSSLTFQTSPTLPAFPPSQISAPPRGVTSPKPSITAAKACPIAISMDGAGWASGLGPVGASSWRPPGSAARTASFSPRLGALLEWPSRRQHSQERTLPDSSSGTTPLPSTPNNHPRMSPGSSRLHGSRRGEIRQVPSWPRYHMKNHGLELRSPVSSVQPNKVANTPVSAPGPVPPDGALAPGNGFSGRPSRHSPTPA
jgi:TPR repeat protein